MDKMSTTESYVCIMFALAAILVAYVVVVMVREARSTNIEKHDNAPQCQEEIIIVTKSFSGAKCSVGSRMEFVADDETGDRYVLCTCTKVAAPRSDTYL